MDAPTADDGRMADIDQVTHVLLPDGWHRVEWLKGVGTLIKHEVDGVVSAQWLESFPITLDKAVLSWVTAEIGQVLAVRHAYKAPFHA